MKRWLLLPVLALSGLAFADDIPLDQKVTAHAPVGPLRKICQILGTAGGIELRAHPRVAERTILVDVTDARLGTVIEQIERATLTDCRQSDGKWTFHPSPTKEKAYVAEQIARRQKQLQSIIEANQKKFPKSFGQADADRIARGFANDSGAEPSPFEQMGLVVMPETNAICQLLQLVGPNVIAALPAQSRTVFSTSANMVQRPMGNAAFAIYQQLRNQSQLMLQAYTKIAPPELEQTSPPRDEFDSPARPMGMPMVERPAKILLVVTRVRGTWNAEIIALNPDRTVGYRYSTQLPGMGTRASIYEGMPQGQTDPKASTDMVTFSPDTEALAKEIATFAGRQPAPEKIVQIAKTVFGQEASDPFGHFTTDAYRAYAGARTKQMVIALTDAMSMLEFTLFDFGSGQNKFPIDQFHLMQSKLVDDLTGDLQGWYVARSREYTEELPLDGNRAAMRQMIDQSVKAKRLGLDLFAWYATTSRLDYGENFASIAAMLMMMSFTETGGPQDVGNGDSILRFYGLLGPGQRDLLARGGTLTFSQLTPQQQAAVVEMVFGPNTLVGTEQTADPRNGSAAPPAAPEEITVPRLEDLVANYGTEITEQLPRGILPDSPVRMKIEGSPVIMPVGANPNAFFKGSSMDAEGLGVLLAEREIGPPEAKKADMKFRLGVRRTCTIRIDFGPKLKIEQALSDDDYADTRQYTVEQLPADFLQRARRAMQAQLEVNRDPEGAVPVEAPAPNP